MLVKSAENRSRGLSARTSSQRRSSASALSCSALRIAKSLARPKRANVFAAQKQCFCFERLSESKCIRALRFKRSCK
ncbi:hypothetical protein gvb02_01745 [Gardnerella vaginalis]|nr:hypothetical protein gvb02_01745 [Gardnerella vaginalis]